MWRSRWEKDGKPAASTSSKQLTWLGLILTSVGFWLLPNMVITNSTVAAEKIYFSYGAIERSISVDALEAYAKEGTLDDSLATYTDYISPQRLQQLRRVLLTRIQLSPVAVSQFLYTPIGETLLARVGEVIQTEARQPSFYALRAALILAAADPEGLSPLNVLEKFPTRGMRIDLGRSLQIADELETLINQTRKAIALVSSQSTTAATKQQVNFSQLPDLQRRGLFRWNMQTLQLIDRRRNRSFLADIYLPRVTEPAPVIVISHGLGSDRNSFAYLAQQLATYGFAVAVPEHPGSNAEQLASLFSGRANQIAQPNEFVNRPLDITYLLDELQRLDASNWDIQLNLQQVGVIGQSLGGYTALALAGARLNFNQLQTDCKNSNQIWNVSLLLQCLGLQLPTVQYNLQDQRIKAAIAINPITSSIFGQAGLSQIQLPVMIVSSSADTIAPALLEQIQPFSWLTAEQKYLVLIERATHFSTIGESKTNQNSIEVPSGLIGPNSAIARRYISALSVAFCQTYLAGKTQYRFYLSPSYTQAINQAPLNISLVQSLPTNLLSSKGIHR